MAYVSVALSGGAAIFIALLVPLLWLSMGPMGKNKAVGLGAVTAIFRGSIVSPWCWLIVVVFFALFFIASRLNSTVLRVLLFWTPTLAILTLGLVSFALLTYVWMRFGKGRGTGGFAHNRRSMSAMAILRQLFFQVTANSRAFIDLTVSQT